MSSTTLRANIEIDANPARFVSGIQKAEQSLNRLTQGTTKTGQNLKQFESKTTQAAQSADRLSKSATQTSQSLQQMGQKGQQAGTQLSQGMQRATAASNQTVAGMNKATAATSRLNAGTIGTAASIGTMGAGLVSLEASMSNYTKATFKVEKAEQGVEKATLGVQKARTMLLNAENMLKKGRESGKKTAAELQYYEEQVINYREDLVIKTQDLTLKQEKLNIANMDYADTQKLMASSIATTLLGTLSTAAQMISAKTIASTKDTAATGLNMKANIANSRALKLLGIDLSAAKVQFQTASASIKGATFSMQGAQLGLKGLAAGFKGLWLSMGPIGIITILATSLYTAWETSQQFRDGIMWVIDAIQEFIGILKQAIPPLQWIDSGLKALGIDLGATTDAWQEQNAVIGQADAAYTELDTKINIADASVNTLGTDIEELSLKTAEAEQTIQSLDTSVDEATLSVDTMDNTVQDTSGTLNEFGLTASTVGASVSGSMAGMASSVGQSFASVNSNADATTRKLRLMERDFTNTFANVKKNFDDLTDYISTHAAATNAMLAARGLPGQGQVGGDEFTGSVYVMGSNESALNADGSINYDVLQRIGNISAANLAKIKAQSKAKYHAEAAQYLEALGLATINHSVDDRDDLATVSSVATNTHTTGIDGRGGGLYANQGQNIQHHCPPDWSKEANELLRKGIYVPPSTFPDTLKAYRSSHSASHKEGIQRRNKSNWDVPLALWTGSGYTVYQVGSAKHTEYWNPRHVRNIIAANMTPQQQADRDRAAANAYQNRNSGFAIGSINREVAGWLSTGLSAQQISEYIRQGVRYSDDLKDFIMSNAGNAKNIRSTTLDTARTLGLDKDVEMFEIIQSLNSGSLTNTSSRTAGAANELIRKLESYGFDLSKYTSASSQLGTSVHFQESAKAVEEIKKSYSFMTFLKKFVAAESRKAQQKRDAELAQKLQLYSSSDTSISNFERIYENYAEDLGAGGAGGQTAHRSAMDYIRALLGMGRKSEAVQHAQTILADDYHSGSQATQIQIQEMRIILEESTK